MYMGYDKVGSPVIDTLGTSVNDILVNMKAGEVRENIIIKQNKILIDYEELKIRLQYRAEDVKAVKKEMLIERQWDN